LFFAALLNNDLCFIDYVVTIDKMTTNGRPGQK